MEDLCLIPPGFLKIAESTTISIEPSKTPRCIHTPSVLTQLVIAFCRRRRYSSRSLSPSQGAEDKGRAAGRTILGLVFLIKLLCSIPCVIDSLPISGF